jgi:hypothetical protein
VSLDFEQVVADPPELSLGNTMSTHFNDYASQTIGNSPTSSFTPTTGHIHQDANTKFGNEHYLQGYQITGPVVADVFQPQAYAHQGFNNNGCEPFNEHQRNSFSASGPPSINADLNDYHISNGYSSNFPPIQGALGFDNDMTGNGWDSQPTDNLATEADGSYLLGVNNSGFLEDAANTKQRTYGYDFNIDI